MHESFKASFAAQLAAVSPDTTTGFFRRVLKLQDILKANKAEIMAAFPTEDEVVAFALDLWDTYIGKVNFKQIPDWIEGPGKTFLRQFIEQQVRVWYPG